MGKAIILLITVVSALIATAGFATPVEPIGPQTEVNEPAVVDPAKTIQLTIASVGPLLGPPTDRYKIGEQVLVTIRLTNKSSHPDYACLSSDLYQDMPKLTKNGQLIPYTKWQSYLVRSVQRDETCEHEDLPEMTLLKSNEPTVVDLLVVVDDSRFPTGALSWYDPLTPGIYELTIQRRLGCCSGPMIESNKISFEVGS